MALTMKLTLLFVFCASLSLTAAAAVGNPELDAEWEDFKQRYGKEYDGGDGDADEEVRFSSAYFSVRGSVNSASRR